MTVGRYRTPEIDSIWDRGGELDRLNRAAAACAYISGGRELMDAVIEATAARTDLTTWAALEIRYDHDIAAYVEMVRQALPAGYCDDWHRGRTSSDLVETALALGLKDSARQLYDATDGLAVALAHRALEFRDTPIIGRTHGQAAEPTTVGRRFAVLANGVSNWVSQQPVAKLSGPVGVDFGPDQTTLLRGLGLYSAPSTQVVPRWHLAGWVSRLLPLSVQLSTLATTIRLGSQTDIAWCREVSPSTHARGSSAMPHKRNPIRSERAVGLTKLIRHNVYAVVDAGAELWDERDISHSSVERTALVDAIQLTHFVLRDLTGVVDRLEVDEEAARRHTDQPTGLGAVEDIVGTGRTYAEAYAMVRELGPSVACRDAGASGLGVLYDPRWEPELWSHIEELAN